MIVIPAIIAGAGAILKPILIAAGIGALFGAGTSGVGEAVTGIQEHGTFNREVAANTFHAATQGAAEGALIGGAFGAVGIVAAPLAPVVGGAIQPALGVVDDVAKPVVDVVGKAVKPVLGAIDDIVGPTLKRAGSAASSAVNGIGRTLAAPSRIVNARVNAANFRTSSRAVCSGGCLYVMDDPAHGLRKIGVTTNPAKRIYGVQRDVRSKLNYVGISPVDDAFKVEKSLHRQFVSQNVRHPNHLQGREWFNNLSPYNVANVLSR